MGLRLRSNNHQPRIDVLEEELDELGDEYRALRRELAERARYSLLPSVSPRRGLLLALRVAW